MLYTTPSTVRHGRVFRTFSQDLESVALAVITFMSGGILMFFTCFIVTKCFQCYKARLRRKRRKALGEDDEDDDFNAALAGGHMQFEDSEDSTEETDDGRQLRDLLWDNAYDLNILPSEVKKGNPEEAEAVEALHEPDASSEAPDDELETEVPKVPGSQAQTQKAEAPNFPIVNNQIAKVASDKPSLNTTLASATPPQPEHATSTGDSVNMNGSSELIDTSSPAIKLDSAAQLLPGGSTLDQSASDSSANSSSSTFNTGPNSTASSPSPVTTNVSRQNLEAKVETLIQQINDLKENLNLALMQKSPDLKMPPKKFQWLKKQKAKLSLGRKLKFCNHMPMLTADVPKVQPSAQTLPSGALQPGQHQPEGFRNVAPLIPVPDILPQTQIAAQEQPTAPSAKLDEVAPINFVENFPQAEAHSKRLKPTKSEASPKQMPSDEKPTNPSKSAVQQSGQAVQKQTQPQQMKLRMSGRKVEAFALDARDNTAHKAPLSKTGKAVGNQPKNKPVRKERQRSLSQRGRKIKSDDGQKDTGDGEDSPKDDQHHQEETGMVAMNKDVTKCDNFAKQTNAISSEVKTVQVTQTIHYESTQAKIGLSQTSQANQFFFAGCENAQQFEQGEMEKIKTQQLVAWEEFDAAIKVGDYALRLFEDAFKAGSDFDTKLTALWQKDCDLELVLAGHSMGACVAQMIALTVITRQRWRRTGVRYFGFGAPRCGNELFGFKEDKDYVFKPTAEWQETGVAEDLGSHFGFNKFNDTAMEITCCINDSDCAALSMECGTKGVCKAPALMIDQLDIMTVDQTQPRIRGTCGCYRKYLRGLDYSLFYISLYSSQADQQYRPGLLKFLKETKAMGRKIELFFFQQYEGEGAEKDNNEKNFEKMKKELPEDTILRPYHPEHSVQLAQKVHATLVPWFVLWRKGKMVQIDQKELVKGFWDIHLGANTTKAFLEAVDKIQ
ncbi:unnamed protein product, partial [Mesorhabditis spiculigera]